MIDMVVPAPRVRRPFDDLSQPYPSCCSKLCNHPIDPERNAPSFTLGGGDQWVRKKINVMPSYGKYIQEEENKTLLLPDEELLIREELERLAEDDGTPPSSMSSRFVKLK